MNVRIFLVRWGGVAIFIIMLIASGFMSASLHCSAVLVVEAQDESEKTQGVQQRNDKEEEKLPEGLFSPMVRAWVFDIVAIACLVIYFGLSYRKMHTDTFVAMFTVSTLEDVVASGSYREEDEPERGGLWNLDILFPGWPIWGITEFPTKRFLLHFDAVPAFTKKVKEAVEEDEANDIEGVVAQEELVIRVDTSLFVELAPSGIGRFLSKIGDLTRLPRRERDLSRDVLMQYSTIDPHTGELQSKEYHVPRMAEYIKDLIEQAVHQTVRVVCSTHDWEWLKTNTVDLTTEILEGISPIFEQFGLVAGVSVREGEQILNMPMFVVEQIALDPALREAYSEPQRAKLKADALAAEGLGLQNYLRNAEKGGVTPSEALAARALERTPNNITIVASQGGLLGAVGASLLGGNQPRNP